MKFTTTIQGSGNKTGIEVPEDVVQALGAGRRPPVIVTMNGESYRSSVAVMGGRNMVSVSAANRDAEPEAKAFYGTLNYSSQRRYVEPIIDAKTAETRSRRIAKAVEDLKAHKK